MVLKSNISNTITSKLDTMNLQTYERKLYTPGHNDFFILPSGSVIIRNINKNGKLITYKSLKKYKEKSVPMWVECKLHLFRHETATANNINSFFPVFRCCECREMDQIETLPLAQHMETLENTKCIHSKMADKITLRRGTWDTVWSVDLSDIAINDVSYKVDITDQDQHQDFATLREDNLFLAVIEMRNKKKTSILFTINHSTKKPICSNCCRKPCKCFRQYKANVERENPEVVHYWEKLKKRPRDLPKHYDTESEQSEHFSYYGYNHSKILFPIHRNGELQQKVDAKRENKLPLPDKFVPKTGDHIKCKHGNKYNPENVVKISDSITVFEETEEYHLYKPVYAFTSLGDCKVS